MFRNYYMDLGGQGDLGLTAEGTLFCASGAWDENGVFFVAGGNNNVANNTGCKVVVTFDPERPDTRAWMGGTSAPETGYWKLHKDNTPFVGYNNLLLHDRWYGSVLYVGQNASNRMLVMGGISGLLVDDYESYVVTSAGQVTTTPDKWGGANRSYRGPMSAFVSQDFFGYWWFPRVHLLSSGLVFYAGRDRASAWLVHNPNLQADWYRPPNVTGTANVASSVFAPNFGQVYDVILRISPGSTGVEWCNAGAPPGLSWTQFQPSMNFTHSDPSMVLLPDGSIFVVGSPSTSVGNAELLRFRNSPPIWRPVDNMSNSGGMRDYHSWAILLPDGRVFVGGGEGRTTDYAIFRPYYLDPEWFRPSVLAGPGQMFYQDSQGGPWFYEFTCSNPNTLGVTIEKIVLMRPGMSTHSSDREQRYVELQITEQMIDMAGNVLVQVKPPATNNHAPPGYYMAFAVSNQGIPSVAHWVRLTR